MAGAERLSSARTRHDDAIHVPTAMRLVRMLVVPVFAVVVGLGSIVASLAYMVYAADNTAQDARGIVLVKALADLKQDLTEVKVNVVGVIVEQAGLRESNRAIMSRMNELGADVREIRAAQQGTP